MDSPDAWVTCSACQAPVKAGNLADHEARVHGKGQARTTPLKKRRTRNRLILAAAAVVVVAVVAVMILQAGQRTTPDLQDTGDPSWGSLDAPLTVYLFADYQCPFCARFETQGALDHVLETWVEPGQLRIVYKDLAFIGPDSITAAEASQVVWAMDPAAWPSWNRFIFEQQGPEHSGWANRDGIIALTTQWDGVDLEEFTARLDAHEFRAEVEEDVGEARDAGVNSTPILVVGSQRLNANDQAAVDAAIEGALG